MDEVLKFISELPIVLMESVASRASRNATATRLIAAPPPGTPLLVSLAYALEHSGVYLGDGRVAELHGDGTVKDVSLTEFINGDPADPWPIRNGTRIFAACDASTRRPLRDARTLKTALRAAKRKMVPGYEFSQANCHLFTAACIKGVLPDDEAFEGQLGHGLASIGKLERIISHYLNDDGAIAWCGVARSKENFGYRLTDEKKARLRAEGKVK